MSKSTVIDENINGAQSIVPGASQKVSIGGTSSQSASFFEGSASIPRKTSWIKVYSDTDCFIEFGTNPTALADGTSMFHNGGLTDYYGIPPGGVKLAVIQSSTPGNLFITEGQ